jgi:hypothetical protein
MKITEQLAIDPPQRSSQPKQGFGFGVGVIDFVLLSAKG